MLERHAVDARLARDDNPARAERRLAHGFEGEEAQRRAVVKRGRVHDLRTFAHTRPGLDHAP
ncbi:hypothetical protein [Marilutibacter aestuarii]|uniref:GNAT family N-acetyltransferase n=1 Tax=Marilutibacter aestuarii TaxID=1706195 RepID=A0A508AKP3_9GAMM|nr:hypothetical protein [Lysobacter aestuarii]TQD50730.1 hypothetical protein FKV25_03645 [Lysobacter aestuarii]